MTNKPGFDQGSPRTVLVSHGRAAIGAGWLCDVEDVFRPSGFVVCRTHSVPDTVERVERGGLAAAVLVEDQPQLDALSLVRIIRSIDVDLPCWLVTENTSRRTLETALSLSVAGVLAPPDNAAVLSRTMIRFLSDAQCRDHKRE